MEQRQGFAVVPAGQRSVGQPAEDPPQDLASPQPHGVTGRVQPAAVLRQLDAQLRLPPRLLQLICGTEREETDLSDAVKRGEMLFISPVEFRDLENLRYEAELETFSGKTPR